jgi:hypothetical protein
LIAIQVQLLEHPSLFRAWKESNEELEKCEENEISIIFSIQFSNCNNSALLVTRAAGF